MQKDAYRVTITPVVTLIFILAACTQATHEQFCLQHPSYRRWNFSLGEQQHDACVPKIALIAILSGFLSPVFGL